jgi:hypothetical protein
MSSTISLNRLTSKPAESGNSRGLSVEGNEATPIGETATRRIQIIGAPFSNYVWIVRMACEEKGVPCDLVPARMHSPEVSAIPPVRKDTRHAP